VMEAPVMDKCQGCDRLTCLESCHLVPTWGFCQDCRRLIGETVRLPVRLGQDKTLQLQKDVYERIRQLNAKVDLMRLLRGITV